MGLKGPCSAVELRPLILPDCSRTVRIAGPRSTERGLGVRQTTPEALAALAQERPDLLLSDIGLPGEDGYSLIRKVRAMGPGLRDLPAMALTAYASADDRARALEAGFHLHVPKPIEPARLASLVGDLARRKSSA